MPRESAETKGRRLLTEGRVRIVHVTETEATAFIRGTGTMHVVHADSDGWECTCPARSVMCSHVVAVGLVVSIEEGPNR